MRKKIEKIFWDMDIIGNRRKMWFYCKECGSIFSRVKWVVEFLTWGYKISMTLYIHLLMKMLKGFFQDIYLIGKFQLILNHRVKNSITHLTIIFSFVFFFSTSSLFFHFPRLLLFGGVVNLVHNGVK